MKGSMIAAVRSIPDRIDIFRERCWARARLYSDGELDLHEAVDTLQADAVLDGLVDEYGQDLIQKIMADAFRSRP